MDPFVQLVTAINTRRISDVERWLHKCDDMHIAIADRKVYNGELTVIGHAIVSRSDTNVLRILLERAGKNVNFMEQSLDQQIPILHLAAYVGNLEAVELLCNSQDINLDATLPMTHLTALHMSVKGGDPNIVRRILLRAHEYHPQDSRNWFSGFLNQTDSLGMTALHYAAWEGHENMVAQLQKYEDAIDVNPKLYQGITPLHLASWNNRLAIVEKLLAHPRIDPQVASSKLIWIIGDLTIDKDRRHRGVQQSMQDLETFLPRSSDRRFRESLVGHFPRQLYEFRLKLSKKTFAEIGPFICPDVHNDNVTALHCAAFAGHSEIVVALVRALSTTAQARKTLNAVDDHLMTPLHYAVIGGDAITVEELSTNSMVRGNHEEKVKDLTPLDLAAILFRQAKDPVAVQEYKVIKSVLSERQDVQTYMGHLDQRMEVAMSAVNSIMVVAALLAAITFQGWLTPPKVSSALLNVFYWDFNVISLCCAISVVLIGTGAILPKEAMTRKDEVHHVRKFLVWMLAMLFFSVLAAILACTSSSFGRPDQYLGKEYYWHVALITILAIGTCLIGIYFFSHQVHRFFKGNAGKIRPTNFPLKSVDLMKIST